MQRQTPKWAFSDDFLHGRMSFLAGPRQVGKTTAARNLLRTLPQPELYYNWDSPVVKQRFAKNQAFIREDLPPDLKRVWVLVDEIHKYPKWKNILKGYFDEWKERIQFIVTGSARLDLFRRSGDSLVGRYFLYRMLPLGPREITDQPPDPKTEWIVTQPLSTLPEARPGMANAIETLLRIGGFPEPFSVGNEDFSRRWREEHLSLILREDLRDLSRIMEIRKIETLLYLLPEKVGSPLSLNALRNPLECAFGSVKNWIEVLKKVYLLFTLPPWTTNLSRSILREEKAYFWDWGIVDNLGARFENFIAVCLERTTAAWNEWGKGTFRLHYLRTKEGREVDFVVSEKNKPLLLVEAKLGETNLSPHLGYFQQTLRIPFAFQVINQAGICQEREKGRYLIGADRFLSLMA